MKRSSTSPNQTVLLVAASAMFALTAEGELTFYDSRAAFESSTTQPLFREDFESFKRDVSLDFEPTPLFAGALVLSAESGSYWPLSIETFDQGRLVGAGVDFPGQFVSLMSSNIYEGEFRIEFPIQSGGVHAIGFDYSGAAGGLTNGNPNYTGFRLETADGNITEGRLVDIRHEDVNGVGPVPPDDGFFGAHDPDSPFVSLELFTLEAPLTPRRPGAGDEYGIDNLTIALPDGDLDGLPDFFEQSHGLDQSLDDSGMDLDGDEATNLEEFRKRTDPSDADSDGDGINDGTEISSGSDPTDRNDPVSFDLLIDFGANQVEDTYRNYDATDMDPGSFDTKTFAAFGTNISITPLFPDSDEAGTKRRIERFWSSDDSEWNWYRPGRELVYDFLGVDTQESAGGNGDYDGVSGSPTRLNVRLGGLPKGTYTWRSVHHDMESIVTEFIAEVSTDGGATFTEFARSRMTQSRVDDPFTGTAGTRVGPAASLLPSTVDTDFETDGTSDVEFRFTPLSADGPDTRVFGINGFQLFQSEVVSTDPEITKLELDEVAGNIMLTWASHQGETYIVERSTDLIAWEELDDEVEGGNSVTTFTDSHDLVPFPTRLFYRIKRTPR